jgi:hypothetical protein
MSFESETKDNDYHRFVVLSSALSRQMKQFKESASIPAYVDLLKCKMVR